MGRDAQWIEEIADGNRDAFERLYREYKDRIFAYAFRSLHNRESAEEVLNDVMVTVWRSAHAFEGRSKLSTWIFGIARHKTLNRLKGDRVVDGADELIGDRADVRQRTEERLLDRDLVKKALDTLSVDHRDVVELTFYAGLSYSEIAEIVECPVNTVKTRMFHAKGQLRKALARLGEQ